MHYIRKNIQYVFWNTNPEFDNCWSYIYFLSHHWNWLCSLSDDARQRVYARWVVKAEPYRIVHMRWCANGVYIFFLPLPIQLTSWISLAVSASLHVLGLAHNSSFADFVRPRIAEWKPNCYFALFVKADCVPAPSTGQLSACWARVDFCCTVDSGLGYYAVFPQVRPHLFI